MKLRIPGLVLGAVLLTGCQDTLVPDLNNPSLEDFRSNPTRAQVQSLATGVVGGDRAGLGAFIRDLEIVGRDAYNLDAADPRWVTELLQTLDPGGFGRSHWGVFYRNIATTNIMIEGVQSSEALSAGEKAGALGFARTMKALELLRVTEARDTAGVAADAGDSPTDLTPLLCRASALTRIAALLDSARADLNTAGAAFPFTLPSGFAGFDTPASFLKFNRGLMGKVEIYRGKTDPAAFGRALTALNESFLTTTGSLDLGVYHVFSLAAGDSPNPLYQDTASTNFRAHPSVRPATPLDQRILRKTAISSPKAFQNVSSNVIFTVYSGPTAPLPIMRNEELILLRAQANIGINTLVSLEAARADLNVVRDRSGGLAPYAPFGTDQSAAIDALLYEKRYSLLWESPSRWVDARFYGRLASLPKDQPTHVVHPVYPIPQAEVDARSGNKTCS